MTAARIAARFQIASITKRPNSSEPYGVVELTAAINGETNKEWAHYTPNGRIEMTVRGPALPWFEERLGQEIALTFEDVPALAEV